MTPKNAIKPINIQKSHSVHIGSIRSNLVHTVVISPFGPIQSTLSTKVLFGPLWSTLASFGSHWSYYVHLGPLHIGPISSILPTFVLFSPFCPLWSYSVYSVQFSPTWSIMSTLVDFSPIRAIRYTLVLFSPFFPLRSYPIHIGPVQSTSV